MTVSDRSGFYAYQEVFTPTHYEQLEKMPVLSNPYLPGEDPSAVEAGLKYITSKYYVGNKSPAWDGMGEWPGIDVAELAAQAALPKQILPEYVDLAFTFQEVADKWKFWNRPRFYTCQAPADFYRAEQARLENEADEAKVARQRSHPEWVRLNKQLEAAGYETADCYECGGVNDVDDFTDRLMDQMHGRDWRDVK